MEAVYLWLLHWWHKELKQFIYDCYTGDIKRVNTFYLWLLHWWHKKSGSSLLWLLHWWHKEWKQYIYDCYIGDIKRVEAVYLWLLHWWHKRTFYLWLLHWWHKKSGSSSADCYLGDIKRVEAVYLWLLHWWHKKKWKQFLRKILVSYDLGHILVIVYPVVCRALGDTVQVGLQFSEHWHGSIEIMSLRLPSKQTLIITSKMETQILLTTISSKLYIYQYFIHHVHHNSDIN